MHYLALLVITLFPGCHASVTDADGFTPLFNGRDLSGWVPVNVAPGTFTARDGMIISTGKPTGVMRTERMYENFIVEFEWRHMVAGGNAGFFVWADALTAVGVPFTRAVEVQVLDGRESEWYTSDGDVFPIHGAVMTPDRPHPKGGSRCLPSEKRAKPSPQWNHYRVTAVNGTIKLAVNGKEVSGGYDIWPRKGYLSLESEGSECHFRNLRIKELPPSPEIKLVQWALADEGFKFVYADEKMTGWKADMAHWTVKDWILEYDGKGAGESAKLISTTISGEYELTFDFRCREEKVHQIVIGGNAEKTVVSPLGGHSTMSNKWYTGFVGDNRWHRSSIRTFGPLIFTFDGPIQIGNIYVKKLP